jgi:hypothetical protein
MESTRITLQPLLLFLCDYVTKNKGSAKSLSNIVSMLRTSSLHLRMPWLDEPDALELRHYIQQLKFLDTIPSSRKAPLTQHLLQRIMSTLTTSITDLTFAVALWMGHDGLLRVDEILRPYLVRTIVWGPARRSFTAYLDRTKTHRSGPTLEIRFSDCKGPCAVKALRLLFDVRQLWSQPTQLLFPTACRRSKSPCLSHAWLRLRIKSAVASLGLNPSIYSCHSLRAGGATDLFAARVPYPIIKKMGRWKSDVCIIYFRDQDEVCHAVAKGFRYISSRIARHEQ